MRFHYKASLDLIMVAGIRNYKSQNVGDVFRYRATKLSLSSACNDFQSTFSTISEPKEKHEIEKKILLHSAYCHSLCENATFCKFTSCQESKLHGR